MAFINWVKRWWAAIPVWEAHELPKRRKIHHYRYKWLSTMMFWIEDNIFTVVALIQLTMRITIMSTLFYKSYQWWGIYFIVNVKFYILLFLILLRFYFNTKKRMYWDKYGIVLRTTYKNKHADDFIGFLWDHRPVVMWYIVRVTMFVMVLITIWVIKIIYGPGIFLKPIFYFYVSLILLTIVLIERLNYSEYWIFHDIKGAGPTYRGFKKIFKMLIFNYFLKTKKKLSLFYKGPPVDPYHTPVEWYMGIWKDGTYDAPDSRYHSINEEINRHLLRGDQLEKRCRCADNLTKAVNVFMRMVGYRSIFFFIFMYNYLPIADADLTITKETWIMEIILKPVIVFRKICLKALIIVVFFF